MHLRDLEAAIRTSIQNGERLAEDAETMLDYERFPTAHALAVLAQEEYAKAFLLALVDAGALPWSADVRRALRDHICKQLLTVVLESATTAGGALYGYGNSSCGPWNQYMCLRADGGLEICLGSQAVWTHKETKGFLLTAIVARLWSALAVHAELRASQVNGPWEVTLALAGTDGTVLGGLAEGWQEPMGGFHDSTQCRDSNVLICVERDDLAAAEDARELAFMLGGLIENAWGYAICRFIARTGPLEGQLDWRAVR